MERGWRGHRDGIAGERVAAYALIRIPRTEDVNDTHVGDVRHRRPQLPFAGGRARGWVEIEAGQTAHGILLGYKLGDATVSRVTPGVVGARRLVGVHLERVGRGAILSAV